MATGWTAPLLAVCGLWVLVAVACSPLAASSRLRGPLERWPTDRLTVNYLVVSGAVVAGHAAVFLAGVVSTGGIGGIALVHWTIAVGGGYPAGLWLLVGVVASATGRWTPLRESLDRWLLVGLAAVWYAVVVLVAAAVVFFVLFVLYFPG